MVILCNLNPRLHYLFLDLFHSGSQRGVFLSSFHKKLYGLRDLWGQKKSFYTSISALHLHRSSRPLIHYMYMTLALPKRNQTFFFFKNRKFCFWQNLHYQLLIKNSMYCLKTYTFLLLLKEEEGGEERLVVIILQ